MMRLFPAPLAAAVLLAISLLGAIGHGQSTPSFQNGTATRFAAPILANDVDDRSFAWGDFDQDGDLDLVAMRRVASQNVGLPDVLLMNVNGVLTDQTSTLATASSVAGSSGFQDATADLAVVAADVTGDGRLDLVTATSSGGATAKYLTHPRVYVNRGSGPSGQWLGFTYDDQNRIPTMPFFPNFTSIAAGDVDNDGDIDLCFGSLDQVFGGTGSNNIRLVMNGGTGYFTDVSPLRIPPMIRDAGETGSLHLVDMTDDGLLDIVMAHGWGTQFNDHRVVVLLNGSPLPGYFMGQHPQWHYHMSERVGVADLNLDGQADLIGGVGGIGSPYEFDGYALNTSPPSTTAVAFADPIEATYVGTTDDGSVGGVRVVDLDLDGLSDAVVPDGAYTSVTPMRRCHIYRNTGNPASQLLEDATGGSIAGIPLADLAMTHDVAPFDIDGDRRPDLVVARAGATEIWMNTTARALEFRYPAGIPRVQSASGPTNLVVEILPILPGVQIDPQSVRLWTSVNGGNYASMPMTATTGNTFVASLPGVDSARHSVRYYVEASTSGPSPTTFLNPPNAPILAHVMHGFTGIQSRVVESFQGTASGWTVVNDPSLTSGAWQQVTPVASNIPTSNSFPDIPAAPGFDAEPAGNLTKCFVTQNGALGGDPQVSDVDGGPTILYSPSINLAGTDGVISYERWFFAESLRFLLVEVSGDGVNWTTVESLSFAFQPLYVNRWVSRAFRVGDFIAPTSTVQVRFVVSDTPDSGVVEAAIDRFVVTKFMPPIVCREDLGFGGPGNLALSVCGGDLSSGTTAELSLSGAIANDVAYLCASFTADLVPLFGGTLVSTDLFFIGSVPTDAAGEYVDPGIPGGLGNVTVYLQALQVDGNLPELIAFSNILRVDFLP